MILIEFLSDIYQIFKFKRRNCSKKGAIYATLTKVCNKAVLGKLFFDGFEWYKDTRLSVLKKRIGIQPEEFFIIQYLISYETITYRNLTNAKQKSLFNMFAKVVLNTKNNKYKHLKDVIINDNERKPVSLYPDFPIWLEFAATVEDKTFIKALAGKYNNFNGYSLEMVNEFIFLEKNEELKKEELKRFISTSHVYHRNVSFLKNEVANYLVDENYPNLNAKDFWQRIYNMFCYYFAGPNKLKVNDNSFITLETLKIWIHYNALKENEIVKIHKFLQPNVLELYLREKFENKIVNLLKAIGDFDYSVKYKLIKNNNPFIYEFLKKANPIEQKYIVDLILDTYYVVNPSNYVLTAYKMISVHGKHLNSGLKKELLTLIEYAYDNKIQMQDEVMKFSKENFLSLEEKEHQKVVQMLSGIENTRMMDISKTIEDLISYFNYQEVINASIQLYNKFTSIKENDGFEAFTLKNKMINTDTISKEQKDRLNDTFNHFIQNKNINAEKIAYLKAVINIFQEKKEVL